MYSILMLTKAHINRQLNYPKAPSESGWGWWNGGWTKKSGKSSVASLNTWYQYYSLTQHFEIVRFTQCSECPFWVRSTVQQQQQQQKKISAARTCCMLFMDMQYAHTEIAISCAIPIVTCAAHTLAYTNTNMNIRWNYYCDQLTLSITICVGNECIDKNQPQYFYCCDSTLSAPMKYMLQQ